MTYESPLMILASPGRIPICVLSGIDEHSVSLRERSNNTDLLSFEIHKYVDGELSNGYNWIDEQMELYVNGTWYCINNPPSTEFDSYDEIKTVSAESDEIKLLQYMLTDFAINTGAAHSYEYMYKQAHDPDSDKYYQVKFYDEDNPELSLLHIVLSHGEVPGWKIGYVDDLTVNSSDNKTFLPDEICYFDIAEQSVYSFLTQEVSTTCRCVFEFDTKNMLINVYRAESLGKDTNVLLDFQNVQNSINISRDKQLVTVFDVKGESPIDISYVNPVGGSLIEDLSFFCKKPYMTDTLIQKYKTWCELRNSYKDEYFNLTLEYHRLQDIINELTDRVPTDSAINDWTTASVEDLQEAYNTNMAIVKGLELKFQGTNDQIDYDALKASEDWPLYESIRNYTIPAIVAALQNKNSLPEGNTDYGYGNLLQNPVPVTYGTTWETIGDGIFFCRPVTDVPDFGMTSACELTTFNGASIKQTNIKTTVGDTYCISVYVKPTADTTLTIYHHDSSSASTTLTNYEGHSFEVIGNTWQRVYCSFTAKTQLTDVGFEVISGCTVYLTGMQMELGDTPKLFSYYIYGDSELKAYETDWKLYGVDELKAKLTVYQNNVDIMTKNGYSIPWNEQSAYDEPYHTQLHQKYLDFLKLRDDCQRALDERIAERTPYEEEAEKINQKRIDINIKLQKENFGTSQNKYEGFTEKELFTLNSLRNQQTYTNPNIVSTSLTTMQDIVGIQKTLYDDAMDRLYVEAHPQYTYSDTVDNILALPEFSEFHDELAVNNFIRIAIDDSDTYVKLRVTEIESNPFTNENNLQIIFSNMVMYRSKRDDLAYLINDTGNVSSKGQIVGNTNNDVVNYLLTPEIITQLFANSLFQAGLGGVAVGGAGSGGSMNAEKIVAELVKADEGVFGKITSDTGLFKYLDSEIINASQLFADVGHFKDVVTGKVEAEEGEFVNISAKNAVLDTEFVYNSINAHLSASDIKTGELLISDNLRIVSENGRLLMNGQALQITGIDSNGNEYVGIQLGYDTSSTPSLILRDETGALLLTPTGITENAIADELIINDMVKKSTLSKDRMAFNVANANDDGTIDIGTVVQDGQSFDQIYATFKDETLKNYSEIKQTSDLVYLLVKNQESGDYSSFELTDKAITAITNQFVIKDPDGNTTIIEGGKIQANAITTNMLSTDAIKSANYSYSSGIFSNAGTFLNLVDGAITTPNFAITSDGKAYFNGDGTFTGTIYATSGEFTGDIKSGSTITCGDKFYVDANGKLKAVDGEFSGTISSSVINCGDNFSVTNTGEMNAKAGYIGGWTIGEKSLYNQTNALSSTIQGIYLGTDGFLNYNAENKYVKIAQGQIIANSGNIGGFVLENHRLYSEIPDNPGDELTTSSGISIDANTLTLETWYGETVLTTEDWYGHAKIWGESVEASYGNFNVVNLVGSDGDFDGYIIGEKCIFNHGEFNESLGTFGDLSVGEGLNVHGRVVFSHSGDADGTYLRNPSLTIGDSYGQHLEFDSNEIMAKSDDCTPSSLLINRQGGAVVFNQEVVRFAISTEDYVTNMRSEGNILIRANESSFIDEEGAEYNNQGRITLRAAGYHYDPDIYSNGSIRFQDTDATNLGIFGFDATSAYFASKAIYNRTTSDGYAVHIDSSGILSRFSSASKYKVDIQSITDDKYAYNILKLNPKTWYDKSKVESYTRAINAIGENKDPEEVYGSFKSTEIQRVHGMVAEDVEKAGLKEYCEYSINTEDNTKELEGLSYDKLTTLLIPIMRDVVMTLQEVVPVVKEHIQDENIIKKLTKLQDKFDSFKESDVIQ